MHQNKAARRVQQCVRHTQNFLTCTRTIERLLSLTDISALDDVWEIGPGKGHITRRLLMRCGRLTAVEIDTALHAKLAQRMGRETGLRLICANIMQVRLPEKGSYKVFANLPFSGTSDILRKLTEGPNPPMDAWLIMEKGAAKRFLGKPVESAHSLALKPFFEMRIAYHMRKEDYHPMPSVDSVLVHIHRKDSPDLQRRHVGAFIAFVRNMQPCLRRECKGPLTYGQAESILRQAAQGEIPQSATLSYVQWLCLFRRWARLPVKEAR